MTAHVLSVPVGAGLLTWVSYTVMAIAIIGAVFARERRVRRALGGIATCAVVASALLVALATPPAVSSGNHLVFLQPQKGGLATAPVIVHLAELTPTGRTVDLLRSDQRMVVFVDGTEAAEGALPAFAIRMRPGLHHVRAELTTSDHRAYTPPVQADMDVDVGGSSTSLCPTWQAVLA